MRKNKKEGEVMAYLEFNALSTVLCSSFSAKIFLPEMDKLLLDDEKHEKKYPVLWLLHNEGGTALDFTAMPVEKCAVEMGIFIIAPDAQHTLGTDMVYGPKYEEFLSKEFPAICRNNLPLSKEREENWIGGVGTGAYGAVKAALNHPEVFSRCVAVDGIFDMDATGPAEWRGYGDLSYGRVLKSGFWKYWGAGRKQKRHFCTGGRGERRCLWLCPFRRLGIYGRKP